MKKRAVSVLLAAAVTMAAVTGCGGTGEGGATPAENTETD
ncbi:MAG: metal ABC transporter substrate-binding protein, partial [Lachnospiraceae bacterium]|nr:metal ABC transporter substrate-binding protein [Lachnospiraceae bacterium]